MHLGAFGLLGIMNPQVIHHVNTVEKVSNATWCLQTISDDTIEILVPVEFCSSARVGTHHHLLSNDKWFHIGVIEKVAIDGRSNVLWIQFCQLGVVGNVL